MTRLAPAVADLFSEYLVTDQAAGSYQVLCDEVASQAVKRFGNLVTLATWRALGPEGYTPGLGETTLPAMLESIATVGLNLGNYAQPSGSFALLFPVLRHILGLAKKLAIETRGKALTVMARHASLPSLPRVAMIEVLLQTMSEYDTLRDQAGQALIQVVERLGANEAGLPAGLMQLLGGYVTPFEASRLYTLQALQGL